MAYTGALFALTFAAAGVVQAQTAAPAPAKAEDSSLTWKGITLYGIIDIGVQYDTHSAPFSDYFPATSGSLPDRVLWFHSIKAGVGLSPSSRPGERKSSTTGAIRSGP